MSNVYCITAGMVIVEYMCVGNRLPEFAKRTRSLSFPENCRNSNVGSMVFVNDIL